MFRLALKTLREREGISQYKFAEIIGVSQSTVGMWESGKNKPEYETLIKIADFFNVSIDYLTGKTDNPKPPELKKASSDISTEEALLIAIKGMLGRDPTDEELKRFLDMGKIFFNVQD